MSRFDKIIDRRNTGSLKWNVAEHELPMWVADMDFETAPAIIEALRKRVEHGVFGYPIEPDEWYGAYQNWWQRKHGFYMEKEWLIFCTGVIPAVSSAVRKLTCVGENVIVMSPVYNIFYNSIYNNGRNILENKLQYDEGAYHIDFEDFEEKCKDPQSTLLLLSNPQNPIGITWDRATLERIGEICYRNHVTVLSDEIHCDLTLPGIEYVPFASVNEVNQKISVTCIAPTKAFNIAGIKSAAVCVPDEVLRHKMWRALNTDEVAEGNVFATGVAIAAFEHGEEWLSELREYLAENRRVAEQYVNEEIDGLKAVHGDATYLLWIDCRSFGMKSDVLAEKIRELTGLFLSEGCEYRGDGEHFLRMNLACPKSRLEDGLSRLKKAVELIKKQK